MRLRIISALLTIGLFAFAGSTQAQVFNGGGITINTGGNATPYPSVANVFGITGTVTDVTITLTAFSHTLPDDLAALVVGPLGQTILLFSGGSDLAAAGLDLVFSVTGATTLPPAAVWTSGTWLPGLNEYNDSLPAPAPSNPPSYGTDLSVFNGTDVNGNWNLFIFDFITGANGGSIQNWSVNITAVPEPAAIAMCVLTIAGAWGVRRYRLRQASKANELPISKLRV